MPPNFSLQSILDYHHSRVEILEVELGKLLQSHKEMTDLLNQLNFDQERLLINLKEAQSGELNLQKIAQTRFNIKKVQSDIEKQKALLQLLVQAVEAKRLELIEAKQDEAVFDKLKEKELERFIEKQNSLERIQQDDIYTSKAHRQKGPEVQEGGR
jgi:flagellar protein FliJ